MIYDDETMYDNNRSNATRAVASVIYGEGVVTNLEYHRNGECLVMTTNENQLHLIDSIEGKEKKKLYAKGNGGIGKLQYTHNDQCVLFSPQTYDGKSNAIKYLSLYDNRYLRNFYGHDSNPIRSLSMSPIDDYFLSSCDKTIRIWNLSSPNPIAELHLPQHQCNQNTVVSYDGSGVVFGVMTTDTRVMSHSLRLYDSRNYDKGPFQDLAPTAQTLYNAIVKEPNAYNRYNRDQIQKMIAQPWTDFQFSSDGTKILVNTASDCLFILDGYHKEVEPNIIHRKNSTGVQIAATFSADGTEVITGSDDNELLFYDLNTGMARESLPGHVAPVGCVRYNPKYDVIASACVNTALWQPV